jgi:hypothetical protein
LVFVAVILVVAGLLGGLLFSQSRFVPSAQSEAGLPLAATTVATVERQPIRVELNASLPKFSLRDLVEQSEMIVVGTVETALPARWNTTDGQLSAEMVSDGMSSQLAIFTDHEIAISEVLKGVAETRSLIVRTIGGQVGQDIMIVSDDASLVAGQAYFLFLTKDTGNTAAFGPEHLLVTGAIQGAFRIEADKAIGVDQTRSLEELRLEVKSLLQP